MLAEVSRYRMPSSWERLGLTPDEWRDCQLAAMEMSVAAGARVLPQEVALEFALARAYEDAAHAQAALAPTRVPARLPSGARP